MINLTELPLDRRTRHAFPVTDVAIASNKGVVLSGSADASIKVWNLSSGQELQTLKNHTAPVKRIILTQDGRIAVSASADHKIIVWDVVQGTKIFVLQGHTDSINDIAMTSDENRIISASSDRSLRIWNIKHGAIESVLEGHVHEIDSVVMSPNNQFVFSSCLGDPHESATLEQGEIIVWDFRDRKQHCMLRGHTLEVDKILPINNQRIATSSLDGTIRLWDFVVGVEEKNIRASKFHSIPYMSINNEREVLIYANNSGLIGTFDYSKEKNTVTNTDLLGKLNGLTSLGHSKYFATTSWEGEMIVWRTDDVQPEAVYRSDSPIRVLTTSPDGELLALGGDSGNIHVLRLGLK